MPWASNGKASSLGVGGFVQTLAMLFQRLYNTSNGYILPPWYQGSTGWLYNCRPPPLPLP